VIGRPVYLLQTLFLLASKPFHIRRSHRIRSTLWRNASTRYFAQPYWDNAVGALLENRGGLLCFVIIGFGALRKRFSSLCFAYLIDVTPRFALPPLLRRCPVSPKSVFSTFQSAPASTQASPLFSGRVWFACSV